MIPIDKRLQDKWLKVALLHSNYIPGSVPGRVTLYSLHIGSCDEQSRPKEVDITWHTRLSGFQRDEIGDGMDG